MDPCSTSKDIYSEFLPGFNSELNKPHDGAPLNSGVEIQIVQKLCEGI